MDELDKLIRKVMQEKIYEPPGFANAIKTAFDKEKKNKKKKKSIKKISSTCV